MASDRLVHLFQTSLLVSRPNAKCRLFCFHWAGGGAAFFIRWARAFSENVEVLALRSPGRETRLKEQPYDNMKELTADACSAIRQHYNDKPFVFFGHSFGARVCFETASLLKSHGLQPAALFVSGSFAPHSEEGKESLRRIVPEDLSDASLIHYLQNKGGTPVGILNDTSMLEFILPPLRTDLTILRTHRCNKSDISQLNCPLIAMDGQDDIDHNLAEWSEVTRRDVTQKQFSGGHFYLTEPGTDVALAQFISQTLSQHGVA